MDRRDSFITIQKSWRDWLKIVERSTMNCVNYQDGEQAVQQQEKQNEYERVVQERLEEAVIICR